MKLINAEVLKYWIKSGTKEGQKKVSLSKIMNIIDCQDSIRHESIVHCKDCGHLFDGSHRANCCEVLMAKAKWVLEITVEDDWYCKEGERRKNCPPHQ